MKKKVEGSGTAMLGVSAWSGTIQAVVPPASPAYRGGPINTGNIGEAVHDWW